MYMLSLQLEFNYPLVRMLCDVFDREQVAICNIIQQLTSNHIPSSTSKGCGGIPCQLHVDVVKMFFFSDFYLKRIGCTVGKPIEVIVVSDTKARLFTCSCQYSI